MGCTVRLKKWSTFVLAGAVMISLCTGKMLAQDYACVLDRANIINWADTDLQKSIRMAFQPDSGTFGPNLPTFRMKANTPQDDLSNALGELASLLDLARTELPSSVPNWTKAHPAPEKKIKKGPLVLGLAGIGLMAGGAYLVSTYERPPAYASHCPGSKCYYGGYPDLSPFFETGNRKTIGISLVGLGATFSAVGFFTMR